MPSMLENIHQSWVQGRWLPAVINMRSRPQLVNAAAVLRAQEWEAAAQGQGWHQELSAEIFTNVVKLLVETAGDPPAQPGGRALARAVARGQAPDDVIEQTETVARRLAPSLDVQLPRAATDQERQGTWGLLAGVAALLMLPRIDVLRLRVELPAAVPGVPDTLGEKLQAAFDAPASTREELLCAVLDDAVEAEGAPPAAIPVLEALVYGGQPLRPVTLRRCVDAMSALVPVMTAPGAGTSDAARKVRNSSAADIFGIIAIQADAAGLGREAAEQTATAIEGLLAADLFDQARLSVGLNAARRWMRLGQLDRSDAILADLPDIPGPTAELRIAELQAQIRARCGDRHGATAVLLRALDREGGAADVAYRRAALLTLIGSWPVVLEPESGMPRPDRGPDGQELSVWIDRAERLVDTAGPAQLAMYRGQLMTALLALGCYSKAAAVRAGIDFASWAKTAGFDDRLADVAEWSEHEIAWAAGRTGESVPGESVPGDEGKDYASLGLEPGRSAEAAALAEDRGRRALAAGATADAYSYLSGAGEMYLRARDFPAALDAFDRAFALLEEDLQHIPYPQLVISRLADWPDRYHVAALAALEAGQPLRALSYAETGRARAIQGRLGLGAQPPAGLPDSAEERSAWERYCALWRLGVSQAAAELVSVAGPGGHPVAPDVADELTLLRRRFAAAGIPSGALAPVAPPVDAADFPARLAAAERPTVILYSLVAWNQLRFIRITADGADEIPLDEASRRAALAAVRDFAELIHTAEDTEDAVQRNLPTLLEQTGTVLEPVLRQSAEGYAGGRLIWVPQGNLAALPVQALPLAGGYLCDTVAVLAAESLAAAVTGLAPVAAPAGRCTAIRGTPRAGAPTAGAATLLPPGSPDNFPETVGELAAAAADATLVYLSCHGDYDWADPLSSALLFGTRLGGRPGFALKIADLFDRIRIGPNAVVILGACDSGTVAQTDLNEGIGIPGGLLAAGASTVIGAGWPVARAAAVGICRKLIGSLLAGAESPEALRDAACWLRDATAADLLADLNSIAHPAAEDLARLLPEDLAGHMFIDPVLWAAFSHWGAPWKTIRQDRTSADGIAPGP